MLRRIWGIWGMIIPLGAILISGWGCSWHRTEQGWMLRQSKWTLEYKRAACSCNAAAECAEGCAVQLPKEPECTSDSDEEGGILNEADPKQLEKLNSSPFAKLLARRGRLGVCASCGHLGRFKEPEKGEQAQAPVIARFVPVPTQPVFCPRDENMQPVSYEKAPIPKERESSSPIKKPQPKAPLPEVIPPPPITSDMDKSGEAVPRRLDTARETSSWIFSSPGEKKPEQLIEAQLPPRPSERGTR
ncbi:MAG: hypothetical protein ABSA26_04440 [Thermoguttaceae bacterium]|jgi:hypothetical protein